MENQEALLDGVVPLQKHHVLGELKQISLQINFISNVKRETGAQRVGEGKGQQHHKDSSCQSLRFFNENLTF